MIPLFVDTNCVSILCNYSSIFVHLYFCFCYQCGWVKYNFPELVSIDVITKTKEKFNLIRSWWRKIYDVRPVGARSWFCTFCNFHKSNSKLISRMNIKLVFTHGSAVQNSNGSSMSRWIRLTHMAFKNKKKEIKKTTTNYDENQSKNQKQSKKYIRFKIP